MVRTAARYGQQRLETDILTEQYLRNELKYLQQKIMM